jgi:hypothetical protein
MQRILVWLSCLAVAACAHADSTAAPTRAADASAPEMPIAVGERIASYVLERADVKGSVRVPEAKLTLLDFFGTFCGNSRLWFRVSQSLLERYGPSGLAVVGVSNFDEAGSDDIVAFAKQNGATFPIVLGGQKGFARALRPPNWQAIVIVDKGGVVRHVHHGTREGDDAALEAEVKKLLAAVQ